MNDALVHTSGWCVRVNHFLPVASLHLRRDVAESRWQGWETAAIHPAFPPASSSKSGVIGRDRVLFAASRHQFQRSVRQDFGDGPELVNLV